jgi:hypothetical protein
MMGIERPCASLHNDELVFLEKLVRLVSQPIRFKQSQVSKSTAQSSVST